MFFIQSHQKITFKSYEDVSSLKNAKFLSIEQKSKFFDIFFNGYTNPFVSLKNLDLKDEIFKNLCDHGIFKEAFENIEYPYINIDIKNFNNIILFFNVIISNNKDFIKDLCFVNDKNSFNPTELNHIINHLSYYIKKNINIKILSLSSCGLNDDHIEMLSLCLNHHKNIDSIYLDGNKNITDKSLEYLLSIASTTKMRHVSTCRTSIENKTTLLNKLIENRINNIHEDYFEYKFNGLNDENIIFMSKYVNPFFNKIRSLSLGGNEITSNGACELFRQLIENKKDNLSGINLSYNYLDDKCMDILGELIKSKEKIKSIDICGNNITDEGLKILSNYIHGNISIRSINLFENIGITNNSLEIIKNMITLSHITEIKIGRTGIDYQTCIEINNFLKIPTEDREVPLITIGNVKSASKKIEE